MSEQNVLSFINKVHADTSLQRRIQALKTNNLDDLITLASGAGFAFTIEEWNAVKATSFGAIDDAALDKVAGGAVPIQCNASPVSLQCNEKSAGVLCDLNPMDFSNSLSLFKFFGK